MGERKGLTMKQAAELMNVSARSISYARKVQDHGVPELEAAVWAGTVKVSTAAEISALPPEDQREVLRLVASGEAKNARRALRRVRGEPETPKKAPTLESILARQISQDWTALVALLRAWAGGDLPDEELRQAVHLVEAWPTWSPEGALAWLVGSHQDEEAPGP